MLKSFCESIKNALSTKTHSTHRRLYTQGQRLYMKRLWIFSNNCSTGTDYGKKRSLLILNLNFSIFLLLWNKTWIVNSNESGNSYINQYGLSNTKEKKRTSWIILQFLSFKLISWPTLLFFGFLHLFTLRIRMNENCIKVQTRNFRVYQVQFPISFISSGLVNIIHKICYLYFK